MNPSMNNELPPIYTGQEQPQMPDILPQHIDGVSEVAQDKAVEQGIISQQAPPLQFVAPPAEPVAPPAAVMNPLIADDADLIEKDWVERAKHIVELTRNDPRAQANQLSHMKADYVSRRFGKDIKTDQAA